MVEPMKDSYQVGKFRITHDCYLTYPCQHYIQDLETGEVKRRFGHQIFQKLKQYGLSHEHFNAYEEYIQKHENPIKDDVEACDTEIEKILVKNDILMCKAGGRWSMFKYD